MVFINKLNTIKQLIRLYRPSQGFTTPMKKLLPLIGCLLPALSQAAPVMNQPGSLLTTGTGTTTQTGLSVLYNPAAGEIVIEEGESFRWGYLSSLGFSFEVGDADNFVDDVNELTDTLDSDNVTAEEGNDVINNYNDITKKIIDDILEFGKVQEAIIGFVPDLREDDIEGVRIGDFAEGSNAEKAGLAKGDIIIKINNVKISKFSELTGQLSAKRPGESVELIIDRNGQIFTKTVNLIKRIVRYISRSYGIELIDDPKGAKIIRDGLSEDNSSSIKGYIITKINGTKIDTASEAIKLLDGLSRKGYRLKVEMIDLNGEVSAYFF